jgi:CSLREA domain-containing protein
MRAALLALPLAAFLLTQPSPAHGAAFTVNNTLDAVDATPGNGICADATGACTLRAAIMEANALAGADTITLPLGTYTLAIPGPGEDAAATGDLDIDSTVTITGAGASSTIIDGGDLDRVIHSAPNGQVITVRITGVTVQGGRGAGGAGIFNGRFGLGLLELTDSTVRSNVATGGSGGGILNIGMVRLENVIIRNNDGAVSGGGIFNQGTITISGSSIRSNVANSTGGGIDSGGTAVITDTTIDGNTAGPGSGGGGGVYNFGTMELANSTVSSNSSDDWGGGLGNSGPLTLTNVTVSGNVAGAEGGGLWHHPIGSSTLLNVTINANTAATGGGIYSLAGAFLGVVTTKNTIVADNIATDCAGGVPITSLGHNLDSDGTCGLTGTGDLPGVDPLLGPLADNGGPTQTRALLVGSPAIDAGDNSGCPATDQRGVARPQGSACDIGAYEFQPASTPTPTAVPSPSPTAVPSPSPAATPAPTSTPGATPTPTLAPISLPPTGDGPPSSSAGMLAIALLIGVGAAVGASLRLMRRRS